MADLHIEFDMPSPVAAELGLTGANAAGEVGRMIALSLYEHGRISLGKACKLGGFTQWDFADMNRSLEIPLRYGIQDLADDLARLRDV